MIAIPLLAYYPEIRQINWPARAVASICWLPCLLHDSVTERGGEALEDTCGEQKGLHLLGLPLEHYFSQVVQDIALIPARSPPTGWSDWDFLVGKERAIASPPASPRCERLPAGSSHQETGCPSPLGRRSLVSSTVQRNWSVRTSSTC